MGLTREGEGGESGDLGERRGSSRPGEGDRPLKSGERSLGDLEAGE